MLMWEISSGQQPFADFEHNYELAINLIKGMRPHIVQGTPTEYKNLMVKCWDADPLKRYDIDILYDMIKLQKYENSLIKMKIKNKTIILTIQNQMQNLIQV